MEKEKEKKAAGGKRRPLKDYFVVAVESLGVVAAVESVFTAVESDFTASVVSLGFLELQAAATTMATTAERIIILFFISKLWLKFGLNQKMLSG